MTSPPRSPAVEAFARRAAEGAVSARQRVAAVVGDRADDVVGGLLRHARLTINFHPDRRDRAGRTVVAGLLADGRYRTQFETGISNGSRSALAGGQRVDFERALFGDVYASVAADPPIYGALDIVHDPHGGSPSFGSCALVLAERVKRRATFTVGDSHLRPADIGTVDQFGSIAAGIVEGALARDLHAGDWIAFTDVGPIARPPARDLTNYVEAQIHGGVSLGGDVVALLADPAYRSTEVERSLVDLAARHELELRWHGGTIADVDAIPVEWHGEAAVQLGHALARADGTITAREIGTFAAALPWEDQRPDGDPRHHPLQTVKYLWQGALVWGRDLEL